MASRIVTSTYRYKRPPRKRKAVALEVPAIVPAKKLKPRKAPATQPTETAIVSPATKRGAKPEPVTQPADDDRKSVVVRRSESFDSKSPDPVDVAAPSAAPDRKSAIVTARKPSKLYGELLPIDAPEPKNYEATTARFRDLIAAKLKKRP